MKGTVIMFFLMSLYLGISTENLDNFLSKVFFSILYLQNTVASKDTWKVSGRAKNETKLAKC